MLVLKTEETILKDGSKTIVGVTANNENESGRAIRRRVAKGESNPAPLFPDDNLIHIGNGMIIHIQNMLLHISPVSPR